MATLRSLGLASLMPLSLVWLILPGCDNDSDSVPPPPPADSVTIDLFSSTVAPPQMDVVVQAADILGGEVNVSPASGLFEQSAGQMTTTNQVAIPVETGGANLRYDGVDGANPLTLGPADLTASSQATQFEVVLSAVSCTGCILGIVVTNNSGGREFATILINAAGTLLIPFSSFMVTSAGLDFASVDRINVEVRFPALSQGESVSIDSVRTVP